MLFKKGKARPNFLREVKLNERFEKNCTGERLAAEHDGGAVVYDRGAVEHSVRGLLGAMSVWNVIF